MSSDWKQYSTFPFIGSDDITRLYQLIPVISDGTLRPELEDVANRPQYWLLQLVNFIGTDLGMTTSESNYWIAQAALLDPAAYQYVVNTNIVVPANETWYLIGAFGYQDFSANRALYVRQTDARNPVTLPGGTTLTADGGGSSAYIARPSLVSGDPRYDSGNSARQLYYDRLSRLSTLPLFSQTVHVTTADAFGANVFTTFPADFSGGLISVVSNYDVSWTVLSGATGALNLWGEISDDHQQRLALATILPWTRTVFPNLKSRPASVSGTAGTMLDGYGSVLYHKLPANW